MRKSGQETFEGTVEGFRDVDLKKGDSEPQRHTFAKITLKNGSSKVVDLGGELEGSSRKSERPN